MLALLLIFMLLITEVRLNLNEQITGETETDCIRNVEIRMSLKYLSNFLGILEMPLINCEINITLTWSDKCVLSNDTKAITFPITNTKLYVAVVILSTQKNAKVLELLKSDFKKTYLETHI